jgi:hypothetical protein
LDYIDSEIPDEDKFNAMKSLFYSVISSNVSAKDQILNYQLFQIAKGLTSSQLLVLMTCYDIYQKNEVPIKLSYFHEWLDLLANRIGHGISSLIERDEETLVENILLTPHKKAFGKEEIAKDFARLSGLGIKLCENLIKYDYKEMMSNSKNT